MTFWSCFRRNDSFRDPGSSFRAVNAGSPWWPAHRTGQVKWMAKNSPWNEMVKTYGSQGKLMINLVGWFVDDGRLFFRQTLLGLESFVFKCLMFEAFSAVFQCLTDVLFLFFFPSTQWTSPKLAKLPSGKRPQRLSSLEWAVPINFHCSLLLVEEYIQCFVHCTLLWFILGFTRLPMIALLLLQVALNVRSVLGASFDVRLLEQHVWTDVG